MLKYLSAVLLAFTMVCASSAYAAEQKIATISVGYILSKIPQSKAADAAIKKALESKEKALTKLENEAKTLQKDLANQSLAADARLKKQRELQVLQTEYEVKVSEFREEQQKLARKEQQKIMQLLEKSVESVAKSKGITMVIKAEAIAYLANQNEDISEDVIAIVSKAK